MSSKSHNILAVDADADFLAWLQETLEADDVGIALLQSGAEAAKELQSGGCDLLIADADMKSGGLSLLKLARQQDPNFMVILVSNFPTTNMIIESMRVGAYDFLGKTNINYELRPVVERALRNVEERRSGSSTAESGAFEGLQETLVGVSPSMHEVLKMVGRVSRSDAPLTITGESGVGKEVVARSVHRFSSRSKNDFYGINCAAIPDNLIESELFGHEKGSFTGAVAQRIGRFEQCDKGTLFLDEIGDLPAQAQTKLLRVLQEGEFSRVGGNVTLKTSARIIAATHRNLEKEVAEGRFREDLFYRLNVVRIHIPPLRERREDIPQLARHFLAKMAGQNTGRKLRLSEDALRHLEIYDWPGNVRQLENTLRRAAVFTSTDLLLAQDIPLGKNSQIPEEESSADPWRDIAARVIQVMKKGRNPEEVWSALEKSVVKSLIEEGDSAEEVAVKLGMTVSKARKLAR